MAGDSGHSGALGSLASQESPWIRLSWLPPYITILSLLLLAGLGTALCPEECECVNPDEVLCENKDLKDVPRQFPPSITTVDLSRNNIAVLSLRSMAPLSRVANLQLKNNQIRQIRDGAFQNMASLQTLDLSSNQLRTVHQATFAGASRLLHLILSDNRLEHVDGAFAEMSQLTRLDIKNNRLKTVTQFTFRDLEALRYLLLTGNQITSLDRRSFQNLSKLMYLVLKGNPIGAFDNLVFESYLLSYLDISECGLTRVPVGLPNSIRYLQMRRNNLTVLHKESLIEVPYVSILVLDENGIMQIDGDVFSHMVYLQQLWLNGNRLTSIPLPLPPALQRLLMDSNQLGSITDTFPPGSKLNTLSFMGNNITYLAPDALIKLSELRSIDLSNNRLESLYSDTFVNNTQLKTLQLSKNSWKFFYSRCFHGLTNLRTLALAYVDVNSTLHDNVFADFTKLKKLDLDSSPGIVRSIFASDLLVGSLPSVEDLSMQSAELAQLRSDFPDLYPNLATLHISSTRWHCDESLKWFRDWLRTTSVQVSKKGLISCFTPHSLHGRTLLSLEDADFVPATSTHRTTTTQKYFPPGPTTASHDTDDIYPAHTPISNLPGHSTPGLFEWEYIEHSGYGHYDNEDGDEDLWEETFGSPSTLPPWKTILGGNNPTPSPMAGSGAGKHTKYNGLGTRTGQVEIHTMAGYTVIDALIPPTDSPSSEDGYNVSSVLVIIATTVSTVVFLAILVTAIVIICRRRRKKDVYGNAIKYQNRNDVLYFMPGSGTEGSTTDSVPTTTSREQMALVPGRDINHEGPLRVYKWEDF